MTVVKKKLGGSSLKFVKYSESTEGDVLALGEFLGTELVASYDKKSQVPLHKVRTEDGTVVALNSAGQLNHILKDVTPGTTIEVVFLGKESIKTKDGKRTTANQFEVNELTEG